MAWKWLDNLLGRSSSSESNVSEDDTAGGGIPARLSETVEELRGCLEHLQNGKAHLDENISAEAGYKQALAAALTSGLGTTSEHQPNQISSLLEEAHARQYVAILQKKLAEAQAKVDAMAAGNQLGDHRDQLMELADKLVTSREQADFAWLMMQLRISTGRLQLGYAERRLSDKDKRRPKIANLIADIEELLGPQRHLGAALIRPDRA